MSQFSMTSQQQQPIPTGFEQLVYIVSSSKAAEALDLLGLGFGGFSIY